MFEIICLSSFTKRFTKTLCGILRLVTMSWTNEEKSVISKEQGQVNKSVSLYMNSNWSVENMKKYLVAV